MSEETDREPVLTEESDGVLLVTLNRPRKKNAFDDAQWDAALRALRDARENPRVGVVVFTGAGGDFTAGVDLNAFTQTPGPRSDGHETAYDAFMATLIEFDKPLLAAVRGVGIGFGATFLMHCDVVYVGESTRLRFPFTNLGLVPEGASSYLLEAVVGSRQAAELLFTAEWIDADRAVEVGIATRAFSDDDVLEATLAKAREIARYAVSSLQATKRTLLAHRRAGVERALQVEGEGMRQQAGSPENIEAVTAFLQKREPDFRKLRGE